VLDQYRDVLQTKFALWWMPLFFKNNTQFRKQKIIVPT
jgi:hypothetical protein